MLLFNLIGMRLAFGRKLDGKSLLGAGLGGVGIVLVFWPELATVQDASGWFGVACGLAAALLASCSNMVSQRNHPGGVPLLAGTGWAMILGGATLLLISLAQGHPLAFDARPAYIASLLYLALFGSVPLLLLHPDRAHRRGAGGYIAVAVPILAR